jgi:hypothetical protein
MFFRSQNYPPPPAVATEKKRQKSPNFFLALNFNNLKKNWNFFYEMYLEEIKLSFYQKNFNFLDFKLLKLTSKVKRSNIIARCNIIARSNIIAPTVINLMLCGSGHQLLWPLVGL